MLFCVRSHTNTSHYSHKRSKSSLALSILHRDRSKHEAKDDDPLSAVTSNVDSPTGSPTSPYHGFGSLRPSRSKPQAPDYSTTAGVHLQPTPFVEATSSTRKPKDLGLTIEQSVRVFRVFEILRNGDPASVTKAVKENSNQLMVQEKPETQLQGTTILHLAIQCAESSVVEQILSIPAIESDVELDFNAQDRDGNTPLHLASMLGRASIVRSLLARPATDSSVLNYHGRSPLDLARNPDIFQQLQYARALYTENKVHEVQRLVMRGDYEGLGRVLEDARVEAVLDVNGAELATDPSTVESGGTLLHEAARKKDLKLIQLLLLHGADPFRRDRKGKLPQDITKDDRTRAILKRSPAAAAAQRGIQERAILGSSPADSAFGSKESREMKGYLKKWTNYTSGYKLRWFVLEDGVLSYYKNQGKDFDLASHPRS